MKLEDQVCSMELARKLKNLDVKQESIFWWGNLSGIIPDQETKWRLAQGGTEADREGEWYAAFTVAELGAMLPARVSEVSSINQKEDKAHLFHVKYDDNDDELGETIYTVECGSLKTREIREADARAKMMIYLIENRIVKPELLAQ